MAELTEELKRRITTELATFRSAAEVRTMLRDEYGEDVTTQVILRYDATKEYCSAGDALRKLFRETRTEFVEGLAGLYIANASYRLRKLQALSENAERQGNIRLAADLLEQAAKEVGGAFTNVRQLEGRVAHVHMTPDQARERLRSFQERQRSERGETKH